jgi:hypothetical protein
MATARSKIVNKLVTLIKEVDGTGTWVSDLYSNVENRLKFWDEVDDYPAVFLNAGPEAREYQPGGFKWAYLSVTCRIYVQDEEPEARLEEIFEDIEKIVDDNGSMEYETGNSIEDMKLLSINTDEGLLNPIGVGEITLQIMYGLDGPC